MANNRVNNELEILKEENKKLKKQIDEYQKDIEYLHWFYGTELEKINFERFLRLNILFIKNNGIIKYLGKFPAAIKNLIKAIYHRSTRKRKYKKDIKTIKNILNHNSDKEVFIFYPGYDWYMKMYQRPQHMAIHFSNKDILYFYCTGNFGDNINGIKEIKENLYVTNMYEDLKNLIPHYTLYLPAGVSGCFTDEVKDILSKGNKILYEYIDDLHEDLTDIPKELVERHKYILKDSKIPVVTTASYLYEKAKKIRKSNKNLLLSTNGVVYEDFHITEKLPVPSNLKSIVAKKKPIIGYYGALAKWFDYELIEEIAKKHEDWEIILIGIDYDKSLAKYNYFKNHKNINYLGLVEYKDLIKYGNCCDVLTIPFLINEITLSTSPVKVFEYMSMEKPIVTTDLPECRKYKSVLIGKNHKEFIKKLEEALANKDDKVYKEVLRKEALENTWDKKVNEILEFIKSEEK